MLCFSRDTEINQSIQQDFANITKSKQYEGPPSGIVPFHGICMFGMILCSYSIWKNWFNGRKVIWYQNLILWPYCCSHFNLKIFPLNFFVCTEQKIFLHPKAFFPFLISNSGSFLLHLWFTRAIIFYFSCILYSVLSPIDND